MLPLELIWLRRRRFSYHRTGDGMFGYNVRMNSDPEQLTKQLAGALLLGQQKICTAESCTGGLIAKTFTDLAGSSDWFERGFVTYSDQAKNEMLAVPLSIIEDYGAVSEAVATAMASGALRHSRADYSVAVTGVAGPGGGSDEKPVGTVWIAVASAGQMLAKRYQFDGDRQAVREATLQTAIELLLDLVTQA
jgi:nicotinamide-nucleotide amidase